jgi:hypothetical protein
MRYALAVGGVAFAAVVTVVWIGFLTYELGYEVFKIIGWLMMRCC